MSECLQAVVAAALAVQASAPIVLKRHLHWKFHMRTFFFCSLSLISILSAAWHLTQLHFYLRQRTDKNYGSQSWPTRYAFSKSWFNYCLLMVQANQPWTHSHYFQTILHKQRNWFPWLRTHTHTYKCKRPGFIGKQKSRQGHKPGCTTTTIWHIHNWRIRSHNIKRYAAILSHGENMPQ